MRRGSLSGGDRDAPSNVLGVGRPGLASRSKIERSRRIALLFLRLSQPRPPSPSSRRSDSVTGTVSSVNRTRVAPGEADASS